MHSAFISLTDVNNAINPIPIAVRFGTRIAALRRDTGQTLSKLAESTGLDEDFIWRVENGVQEVPLNALLVLAEAFDMTMSDLVEGIGDALVWGPVV